MIIHAYLPSALFALLAKTLLLIYFRRSPVRDTRTRAFVAAVLLS